jgi:GNAT superfamily N-acetyltransferase
MEVMHEHAPAAITPVRTADDLASVIKLFRAYAASLEVDLAYQNFDAEMAAMPGKYAPPKGELLLARAPSGAPIGCVGLRPLDVLGCCEMKRLYVSSEGRGTGLGRRLVEAVIREAERIGYSEIRLDTLPFMVEATALYKRTGFDPMEPYYENSCCRHDFPAPFPPTVKRNLVLTLRISV